MAYQQNTTAPQGGFTSNAQTGYGQGPADKLANAIPGHHTGAPGQLPGSNNPTGHSNTTGAHSSTNPLSSNTHSTSGVGTHDQAFSSSTHHGSNSHAASTLGDRTHGSSNYDSNNAAISAAHGTHQGGMNQGPTDKLANALPGHTTGAPGALPGSNNPSGKETSSHTGVGSHNTTHGSSNYDSNNPLTSATHGTHQQGLNQGPADRIANAAPGHHTGAPGAVPGSHNPSGHSSTHHTAGTGPTSALGAGTPIGTAGPPLGSHGTHGSSTHDSNNPLSSATHGTHEHGINQGPADRVANAAPGHHTGAYGAVPGSNNPSVHSSSHTGAGVGAGGLGATTGSHTGTGSHATTGSHSGAHDPNAKPSMADKIGGKIDVLVGKATHNEEKIIQGEIKQTEGKAGLEHNAGGLGGSTTGAGRY